MLDGGYSLGCGAYGIFGSNFGVNDATGIDYRFSIIGVPMKYASFFGVLVKADKCYFMS